MAEKKEIKSEAEAKKVYEESRLRHEQSVEKHRVNMLEYTLACEDHSRAEERLRNARRAKDHSESFTHSAAASATEAFIELGRIQIANRGNVG